MQMTDTQTIILNRLFDGASLCEIRSEMALSSREILDEIGRGLETLRQQTFLDEDEGSSGSGHGYH